MATSWDDSYAACPFFQRSGNRKISCSGVFDGTRLVWEFDQAEDKKMQMRVFCCDKYHNCEVYRMLREVYEEE